MGLTWTQKGGIWTCGICGTKVSGNMPLFCTCSPLSGEPSPTAVKLIAMRELLIEIAAASGYEKHEGGYRGPFGERLNKLLGGDHGAR